ncbi:hypothetical protein FH972_023864 [Carpinus fangiana]|uniref:Uncharacterized protein n=1 Tax=Carpinus fangiana TaxID=176857 RepID=A0A5N6KWF8_9ROSI|nr:hypothetical protein FH972_023864 [Carpinus fangiana]
MTTIFPRPGRIPRKESALGRNDNHNDVRNELLRSPIANSNGDGALVTGFTDAPRLSMTWLRLYTDISTQRQRLVSLKVLDGGPRARAQLARHRLWYFQLGMHLWGETAGLTSVETRRRENRRVCANPRVWRSNTSAYRSSWPACSSAGLTTFQHLKQKPCRGLESGQWQMQSPAESAEILWLVR